MNRQRIIVAALAAILLIILVGCGDLVLDPVDLRGSLNGTPFSLHIQGATQSSGDVTATQAVTGTPTSAPDTATATVTPTPPVTPTRGPTVTPPLPGIWGYNVNSDFDAVQLPATARQPYADLLAALSSPTQYPDLDGMAARGDIYRCGRLLRAGELALLIAFRYTGDLALLDGVNRSMDKLRAEVVDHDGDGYRSILWWFELERGSSYWGTDTHPMDNIMCHSLIAAYTWALMETGDPAYTERADWWTTYLFDDFVARWAVRDNRAGLPFKDLTHAYLALIQLNYYLARLADATGRPSGQWWASANTYAAHVFNTTFVVDGQYYTWDHRVLGYGHPLYGCQNSEYAGLTMIAVADLALDGFVPFSNPGVMERFAATWRDRVLFGSASTVAGDVCGAGSVNASKYMISFAPVLAMWDTTGLLAARTAIIYNGGGYAGRNVLAPAGAFLFAVTGGHVMTGEQPLAVSFAVAVPEITDTPHIVEIWANLSDGSTQQLYPVSPMVPTPTATFTLSPTVTATASQTLTATNTATATNTPTPGATETAFYTPTPEPDFTLGPTFTPAPTSEPPQVDGCYGTVTVSLSLRDAPGRLKNGVYMFGNRIGYLAQGERVRITEVQYVDISETRADEWAQVYATDNRDGWSAARFDGNQYIAYDETEECQQVRWRWPEYPDMAFGFHNVLPENDPSGLMRAMRNLASAGIVPSLFAVETTTGLDYVRSLGGRVTLRAKRHSGHLGDCPTGEGDPLAVARQIYRDTALYFATYAPPDSGIYVAVDNECSGLWQNLDWLDQYTAETIRQFGERGWKMVIVNGLAGDWTAERVAGMSRTWAACRKYECVLGLHAYGIMDNAGWYWVSDAIDHPSRPWLHRYGGQHNELREWLHNDNPANDAILFWYSEVGTGMGYHPFAPADCPRWWAKVRDDGAGVLAMACWTAGSGTDAWSADGRVEESARIAVALAH